MLGGVLRPCCHILVNVGGYTGTAEVLAFGAVPLCVSARF